MFLIMSGEEYNARQTQTNGFLQGDPLSPLLFNLATADVIRNTISHSNSTRIYIYADDMVLASGKPEDVQECLHKLQKWAEINGLLINKEKTAQMIFRKGSRVSEKDIMQIGDGRDLKIWENVKATYLKKVLGVSKYTPSRPAHQRTLPDRRPTTLAAAANYGGLRESTNRDPAEEEGLMHHEFIPEGRTVTKELYVETLRRLWDAVRRKRPEKWVENNWFLMHDNAPAHRAIIVKNFLARHNITALDHPPYSPDLSPPDYFLFPRLKSHLKGRRFNAEEVIANATRALRRVSQNGFQACFQELYTRWQKCVVAEGNYFEGNAVE
ncbi:hypothetical protein ANN_07516 [Periplaneta americana]|uniref:Reverse transcriptase domain-containing protein n=1 Tax=Periplaneta americana TaxID=6978 RepID=A0ABQ8SYU1_PERAM|nr:hypothetical protein ANN_07516 [Periplaneta americana]